jgi:hypothetical protein
LPHYLGTARLATGLSRLVAEKQIIIEIGRQFLSVTGTMAKVQPQVGLSSEKKNSSFGKGGAIDRDRLA